MQTCTSAEAPPEPQQLANDMRRARTMPISMGRHFTMTEASPTPENVKSDTKTETHTTQYRYRTMDGYVLETTVTRTTITTTTTLILSASEWLEEHNGDDSEVHSHMSLQV